MDRTWYGNHINLLIKNGKNIAAQSLCNPEQPAHISEYPEFGGAAVRSLHQGISGW